MRSGKFTITCLLALSAAAMLRAEVIPVQNINDSNIDKFGGSMYQYIDPQTKLSPAPKGFKPFYLSHYGRHGSRYLLNTSQYENPYNILKEANDKGVLTDFGKTVMDRVKIMMDDADGRLGDLTDKGKEQHKGITRRMMQNYPEIFRKDAHIVAMSTSSHRVIVSMLSGLSEIYRALPKAQIEYNASDFEGRYLNTEEGVSKYKNNKEKSAAVNAFNANHTHPDRLMLALFTDTSFIHHYEVTVQPTRMYGMQASADARPTKQIRDMAGSLYSGLYDLAANMQSHDLGIDLNDVFTYQEWYDMFLTNNMYWYSVSAFSPYTGNAVPFGRINLLEDFLDRANAAIAGNGIDANLRYGHDTALFPFMCLLELNDCGWNPDDLERVADKWVAYDIVHMGANVQMVLFRDKAGKVLAKFLVNEEEATIPVQCYKDGKGREYPHFYEWTEVEKYYRSRIAQWQERLKNEENN